MFKPFCLSYLVCRHSAKFRNHCFAFELFCVYFWNFATTEALINKNNLCSLKSPKEVVSQLWKCKFDTLKMLFRAYNCIIKSISRNLIIFKKPRKMKKSLVIFLGFLKMIKLLVIPFIKKFDTPFP